MGQKTRLKPCRVVLDTNVVVSALLFGHGRMAWLRLAWQGGGLLPLASRKTVTELLRVLAYPKFRLTADEREELLADYLPWVQNVEVPDDAPRPVICRDVFDLPFLQLALTAEADYLVTGDDDLLSLSSIGPIRIVTPARLREAMSGSEMRGDEGDL